MDKTRIYIGPRLSGLNRFTVFQGGTLPSLVKEIIEKRPAVAGLIVYVVDLAQARVDLAKKGHPLNLFFNQVRSK